MSLDSTIQLAQRERRCWPIPVVPILRPLRATGHCRRDLSKSGQAASVIERKTVTVRVRVPLLIWCAGAEIHCGRPGGWPRRKLTPSRRPGPEDCRGQHALATVFSKQQVD